MSKPKPPGARPGKRTRPSSNEIAIAAAQELDGKPWTTNRQRKALGKRLLANTVASGIPPNEAIAQVCEHPMMQSEAGRGPQRSTVYEWFKEITFADIDLSLDETGQVIELAASLDIDERRRQILGRLDMSAMVWTAQRKALGIQADTAATLEKQAELHVAMARCEKIAIDALRLSAQLLHIDKVPPLERLDDPDVRRMLRSHIERQIGYFTADEIEHWRAMFAAADDAGDPELDALQDRLIQ